MPARVSGFKSHTIAYAHKLRSMAEHPEGVEQNQIIAMAFVNLSAHSLTILASSQETISFEVNKREYLALNGDAQILCVLPPYQGDPPEVISIPGSTEMVDGVQITRMGGMEVKNLPEPQEGVIYISSFKVAQATPDRPDVVAPGDLVFAAPHEGRGEIVGCLGLKK